MLEVIEIVLADYVRSGERAEHLAKYSEHGRRTDPRAHHGVGDLKPMRDYFSDTTDGRLRIYAPWSSSGRLCT